MKTRINANESQMYDLGRQARQADCPIESCNLSQFNPLRAWWIAGFHDEDMETRLRESVLPTAKEES